MSVKLREIPGRIYLRYILLNIPAMVLIIMALILAQRWITIPIWLSLTIIFIWLIKDVILFPIVWRAYDWDRSGGLRSMIGKQGIARERLAPSGYVLVQGELWKAEIAEADQPIESGKFVQVVKMEGLKLFVIPEESEVRRPRSDDRGRNTKDY
jgi:membrane-bound serine protease (ClpP class)